MENLSEQFQLHLDVKQENISAIDLLSYNTTFSKQFIKQIMQKGAVWLTREKQTQRLRRVKKMLHSGDTLHCYYNEKVFNEKTTPATLIKDEGDYSIWYKPYGMRSQGSKWGDHTTLYRYAECHLQPQRPAFIVHRLDRAASGLIILSHKKSTTRSFARMFENHQIDKRYHAIVHGHFPESTQLIDKAIDGKKANSYATLLKYCSKSNRSLLEVKIETGRKHQIRRHLSGYGYPIVGDRLYGDAEDSEDLQLTAYYLSFISPINGKNKIYQLPDELLLRL